MGAGIDDFFLKPVSSVKILVHLKKGLRHRKTLLQKRRLEQILNEIKTNQNIQEVPLAVRRVSDSK
jgi:YesN/AraC family two-component response regulator